METIIINSAKRVYEQLGPGHAETTYQKALGHELSTHQIKFDLERHLSVTYIDSINNIHHLTSDRIDVFIHDNDIYNEGNIILELKATLKGIQEQEITQIQKYFRQLIKENTKFTYGVIINFPQPSSKNINKKIDYLVINPHIKPITP